MKQRSLAWNKFYLTHVIGYYKTNNDGIEDITNAFEGENDSLYKSAVVTSYIYEYNTEIQVTI